MAGFDSDTVSLLHMDGADASTSFPDVRGKTWTAHADAQIDTAQSKFGGASGLFDGTGDYVDTPAHADFNMQVAGDWTVDYWFRTTSVAAGVKTHVHFYNGVLANQGLHIYHNGDQIKVDNGNAASGIFIVIVAINTWYHVAVTRASGTVHLFVDGVEKASEAAQNYGDANSTCQLSGFGAGFGNNFPGWIEEFRVSKGIARWTANFTPPTGPYTGPAGNQVIWMT